MLVTNELSRTYPGLNSGAVGTVVRLPHQQTGGSNEQKLLQSGYPGGDRSMAPMVQFWLRAGAITVAVPALTRELADGSGTSRTALPLELTFALTVHRAAGLTLPSIIIHCDTLWHIGGLCYTALSRVATVEQVQLVGSMQNIFSRDDCVDFMQQAAASSAAYDNIFTTEGSDPASSGLASTKLQCGASSSDRSGVKRPRRVLLEGSNSTQPIAAAAAAAEAEAEAEAKAATKRQRGPSSSDGSGVAAARKRPQSATEGSDPASSGLASTKLQCGASSSDRSGVKRPRRVLVEGSNNTQPIAAAAAAAEAEAEAEAKAATKRQRGPSSSDGSGVAAARKRPQSGLAATKLQCGASSSGGRGTERVVLVYPNEKEKDAITLTKEELDRLDNNEFLNDSLIDYQIKVIQRVCVPLVLRMCGPAYTCCALTLLCPPCAHCTVSVTRQARQVPLLQLLRVHKTPWGTEKAETS